MEINLQLPDGQPARRVGIGLSTIDIATLQLTIKVIGYDADGNERIVIDVPHQLDYLRDVSQEELVKIVEAHFSVQ